MIRVLNAKKDDSLLHSLAVLPDEVATDCKGKNRDSESKWDFVALITNGPAACNGIWINKVGSFFERMWYLTCGISACRTGLRKRSGEP